MTFYSYKCWKSLHLPGVSLSFKRSIIRYISLPSVLFGNMKTFGWNLSNQSPAGWSNSRIRIQMPHDVVTVWVTTVRGLFFCKEDSKIIYVLLTKREVKKTEYYPSSYFSRRSRGPLTWRKKRLVFSHLDRKSLVNKGFIIEQKYFALVEPNQREDLMFSLFWLSPAVFLRIDQWHCPRITTLVSPLGLVNTATFSEA